jgi:hypothetical protein
MATKDTAKIRQEMSSKYKYSEDDRSIRPMPTEWTKMKLTLGDKL